MNTYHYHRLSNGIRVVHIPSDGIVAHCGLMAGVGSRNESADENGLAHFIEHAFFKGTHKRNATHIIRRLEDVGGEMNAYTTKEETCIHASFMKEYYERTIELISDVVFNSAFPESEIEKEKEVIADEIHSYKDSPSEYIFDEFEELLFPDHPLGRNILGTTQTVTRFTPDDLSNFVRNHYQPDKIVLASVGNISFSKLIKLADKYLGNISPQSNEKELIKPIPAYGFYHESDMQTWQSHCMIGTDGYGFDHADRMGLYLLNNYLGGPGMSSVLNMTIREKYGYSYTIESNYSPFRDAGNFSVYFGSDKNNLFKTIDLVLKEFKKVRDKKISDSRMARIKKQVLGHIAISSENRESLMLTMAKSILVYDKFDGLTDIARKIEKVDAEQILNIANEVLNSKNLNTLIYV
jgi:predicted Zn-dependent peptidase